MSEDVELFIDDAKDSMQKAVTHLDNELTKIRAGKASPAMLEGVMVDYYGTKTPLKQVANVSTTDARTIIVQAWEKKLIDPIEKAIFAANLGLTPVNNGELIRINVPPLTEERRHNIVKNVRHEGETAKVSVRSIRRDAIEELKKLQKSGTSEDEIKTGEEEIQKLTDGYTKKIDDLLTKKEVELMSL